MLEGFTVVPWSLGNGYLLCDECGAVVPRPRRPAYDGGTEPHDVHRQWHERQNARLLEVEQRAAAVDARTGLIG